MPLLTQDDPEELTTRRVESVRSSDIDFISTDDENSFGHRASMDTGDENVEVKKNSNTFRNPSFVLVSVNNIL